LGIRVHHGNANLWRKWQRDDRGVLGAAIIGESVGATIAAIKGIDFNSDFGGGFSCLRRWPFLLCLLSSNTAASCRHRLTKRCEVRSWERSSSVLTG
jgi:hypothetical protein